MPTVSVLHRRRVVALPDAVATKLAGNAWQVVLPREGALAAALRKPVTFDALDQLVLLIGDAESVQVVGSAEDDRSLTATVLL